MIDIKVGSAGQERVLTKLIMRYVMPAYAAEEEVFLIVQAEQISGSKWENPTAELVEGFLETYLNGCRSHDLLNAQSNLDRMAEEMMTSSEVVEAAQSVLYLRTRQRQLVDRGTGPSDPQAASLPDHCTVLDHFQWWNSPKGTMIPLDDTEDAWVQAVAIHGLLARARAGDSGAYATLLHLFYPLLTEWDMAEDKGKWITELTEKGIPLLPERGPMRVMVHSEWLGWYTVGATLVELGILGLKPTMDADDRARRAHEILKRTNLDDLVEPALESMARDRDLPGQLAFIPTLAGAIRPGAGHTGLTTLVTQVVQASKAMKPDLLGYLNRQDHCGLLELSSHWLEAWFGLHLLESDILAAKTGKVDDALKCLGPKRVRELVGHWASFFHYLQTFCASDLHHRGMSGEKSSRVESLCRLSGPDPEAVDTAELNLLCEWAHSLGVPRVIPLQDWLESTIASELALYALSAGGSYRQHLLHAQDVCLLGCVMLESRFDGMSLKTKLAQLSGCDEQLLLCNWLVASLLHDIGYALQVIPKGIDALSSDTATAVTVFLNDVQERLRRMPTEMIACDPTATHAVRSLQLGNHAHVSVATVCKILERLTDGGRVSNDYNMALAAIVDHDVKDATIDFQTFPLSALIVLCDQLQDWGRPRLNPAVLSRRFMAAIRRVQGGRLPPINLQALGLFSRLYVKGNAPNGRLQHRSEDKESNIVLLLEGERAGEKGYQPVVLWIDFCRAFQRIKAPDGHSHPLFKIVLTHQLALDDLPELRRLHDFAMDDPGTRGPLLDWIEVAGRSGHPAMRYEQEDNWERLTFLLPTLGTTRPLMGVPPRLYGHYSAFVRSKK